MIHRLQEKKPTFGPGAAKQAALFSVATLTLLQLGTLRTCWAQQASWAHDVPSASFQMVLCAAGEDDSNQKRVLEMLRRMVKAGFSNAFIAREVTFSPNGRETEQWVRWDPKRGMRRESIRPDKGEILIDNKERSWRYSPRERRWFERESFVPKPHGRIKDALKRISQGDLIASVEGEDRVAGRTADIVRVVPKQGIDGPARRFWLDRATGLRLKAEEVSPDGRILSSSYYLSLNLSPRFGEKEFDRPEGAISPEGRDNRQEFLSREEAEKAGVNVASPGFLPPGFALSKVEVSRKEPGLFITQRFANGLTVLSLTQSPSRFPMPPRLAEKIGPAGKGFVPNPRGGSDRLYVWRSNDRTYFLFGNLSEDEMKRVANSVR